MSLLLLFGTQEGKLDYVRLYLKSSTHSQRSEETMAEGRAQIIPCQSIHGPGISNWGDWDLGPATRQTEPRHRSAKKGKGMRTLVQCFCKCFAYYLCSQPCTCMCMMCLLGMHAAAGILPLSGFWILHNTFSSDKLYIFSEACKIKCT